ncbi:C4-dicarboxylate ABC transporter [Caldanaerobacter subterraneus subsp. yonseiensis KB-1]|uniref:C4-dicarboxylate ABC transporter n=1 Tax=Caldanaerobacter subterraneus subsp. yonseiensis KB-1 TaxID=1388761 RepID=U5CV40_CALSX|nr:C4-dicarboxylate ABC transporter [Caldanaerobacter subterraneus]ERM91937.1 C4-dicarboxylate ABC transporter [Caldanaerobacter subterraneus subsp. yonseiensis KB-1]
MGQKICINCIIRHFSPAWYASVMGTGGFANVLYLLSARMSFLKPAAVALFFLNIFLFFIFIIPWVGRWFLHFDKLIEDLKHPVMSNFFVTMPVGGLILGTNFFIIGKEFFSMAFIIILGTVLWIYGVALALIFGVFVTYNMMITENIGPEFTNYSWYITPVASIVVPLLGNFLVKAYATKNVELAKLINITDIAFYGIGLILFVILSSIILGRFISHTMPHAMTTPTFWIILGPIGVGTVSLMGIADASKMMGLISIVDGIKMISLIFWGFGLWAFVLTVIITIKYLIEGGIPFSLSWWAFIFPLSAYTLSAYNVFMYTKIQLIYWYTVLLAILLAILWISTFIKSLIGTLNGTLLVPSESNKK